MPSPTELADGRTARRHRNADKLFAAADELLAVRPFDELSVDEICERAGVGRATFFRIYESKTGLLREFNRRLADDATRRLESAGPVHTRAALGIVSESINDAWRHAGRGHLGMARAFVRAVPHTDPHAAHPELLALVARIVGDGVARGELPDVVPVDLAASLVLIQLTAPVAYTVAGRAIDIDRLSRTLLDQWWVGMIHGPASGAEP